MSNKHKNAREKDGMEKKADVINVEMQNRDLKCLVEALSGIRHRMIHDPLTIDFARWTIMPEEITDLLAQLAPYTQNLDKKNLDENIVIPMEQTLWNAYSDLVLFAIHCDIQNKEQCIVLERLHENNVSIENDLGIGY